MSVSYCPDELEHRSRTQAEHTAQANEIQRLRQEATDLRAQISNLRIDRDAHKASCDAAWQRLREDEAEVAAELALLNESGRKGTRRR